MRQIALILFSFGMAVSASAACVSIKTSPIEMPAEVLSLDDIANLGQNDPILRRLHEPVDIHMESRKKSASHGGGGRSIRYGGFVSFIAQEGRQHSQAG